MNINEFLRSLTDNGVRFRAYPYDNGGLSIELIDKNMELFYAANGRLVRVAHYQ